jgi:hypothetical protein
VALCQARISTKPLWGFSSSNPYHSQSRAEQGYTIQSRVNVKRYKKVFNLSLQFFLPANLLLIVTFFMTEKHRFSIFFISEPVDLQVSKYLGPST